MMKHVFRTRESIPQCQAENRLDGKITREGITKELEMRNRLGIGGAE
jgi:hypothetical protein